MNEQPTNEELEHQITAWKRAAWVALVCYIILASVALIAIRQQKDRADMIEGQFRQYIQANPQE